MAPPRPVSNGPGHDPDADAALQAWQAVRGDGSIQFAPLPPAQPPQEPAWAKWLQNWLSDLLGPAGEALGANWPAVRTLLIVLAGLLVAWLAWRLLAPLARWRPRPATEEEWAPERDAALALLEDADALAARGRFAEAVHLLLQRSIGQIRATRPEWLSPSSTAREIAALPALPDTARTAFSVMAERVERALFALRPLERQDWQAARAAYADFALARLDQAAAGAPRP